MSLAIHPKHENFAAEVSGLDLSRMPPKALLAEIVAAWRRFPILVFRAQSLSAEDQLAFSRGLGELDPAPAFDVERSALDGYPEIAVVSNIKVEGKPIGGLGDGELAWHSDMTYVPEPPVGCALYARELPARGGDTCFLDLRAAWRTLPEALRARAAGARIFHDRGYTSAGTRRLDLRAADGVWHAARRTDPVSGEEALFLGRRLNGKLESENGIDEDLLEALWQHCDRPEHVYRHVWQPGDLLLWNNLVAMHRRDAFDSVERRLLLRTQIRRLDPDWALHNGIAA